MTEQELLKALDEVDRRKEQLPTRCPHWCIDQHVQAVEEGVSMPDAAHHTGAEMNGEHYRLTLWQAHRPHGWGVALVHLEVDARREDGTNSTITLPLSAPEARSLAAQLTHLADLEEFPGSNKPTRGRSA